MSAPAAIPLFGDAYLADTRHLTLEEHGAYLLLMMVAWRSESCELPDDDKRLASMLGVTAKKWSTLKPSVMAFWSRTETGWEQKRLTRERKFVEGKRAKNVSAAEARWGPKLPETNEPHDANAYAKPHANAMPNACVIDAPPPPVRKKEDSVARATGASAVPAEPFVQPVELQALLFGSGVPYLVKHGQADRSARSLLGRWRQKYGDGAVIDALAAAQSEAASDPVAMITKILETRNVRSMGRDNRDPSDRPGSILANAGVDLVRQFGTRAVAN